MPAGRRPRRPRRARRRRASTPGSSGGGCRWPARGPRAARRCPVASSTRNGSSQSVVVGAVRPSSVLLLLASMRARVGQRGSARRPVAGSRQTGPRASTGRSGPRRGRRGTATSRSAWPPGPGSRAVRGRHRPCSSRRRPRAAAPSAGRARRARAPPGARPGRRRARAAAPPGAARRRSGRASSTNRSRASPTTIARRRHPVGRRDEVVGDGGERGASVVVERRRAGRTASSPSALTPAPAGRSGSRPCGRRPAARARRSTRSG